MAKTAVRKSAEYEQYYQDLGNKADKIFDSMKDVFMFAATLGFKTMRKLPFQKPGGDDISLRFFRDDDFNIINIIALTETGEMSILLPDDEYIEKKLKIIEEYANGGMSIMVDAFCKPIVDLNAFQRFLESFEDASGDQQKASLEDILDRAIQSVI